VDVVFGLLRVVDFFWWDLVFGGDWECVVEHDVVDGVFLLCIPDRAGCMCAACCKDILLQHISAGRGDWRIMG